MSTSVTFDDSGLIRLRSSLAELRQLKLRIGYQEPGGAERYDSGVTVAKLAAVVEFGIPDDGLPERSFIRSTLKERELQIASRFEVELAKVVALDSTPVEAYSAVGSYVVGLIRHKLETASSWAAPLDDETAAAKGHPRVLDDTGKLAKNLSWRVSIGRTTLAEGST